MGTNEIRISGRVHDDVVVWPHLDLDVIYTWAGDNLIQVEITGLGYTKTITYTYTLTKLTGKTVVIT